MIKKANLNKLIVGFAIFLIVLWGACLFVSNVISTAKCRAWDGFAPRQADTIAVAAEGFNMDVGRYPETLLELSTNTYFHDHQIIQDMLSQSKNIHIQYGYQVSSNGFVVTIARQPQPEHMTACDNFIRQYKYGQVLDSGFKN
ncbi:MAG TPA: hypothetical protein VG347_05890 [Verrucomicrobiae bacterium]|nr:hypothetical protein [Verrucomicrobiae bacterium]